MLGGVQLGVGRLLPFFGAVCCVWGAVRGRSLAAVLYQGVRLGIEVSWGVLGGVQSWVGLLLPFSGCCVGVGGAGVGAVRGRSLTAFLFWAAVFLG